MRNKYRIKLKSGRVIGPITAAQIGELFIKSHIEGEEDCQVFPAGKWEKIADHHEVNEIILSIARGEIGLNDLLTPENKTTLYKIDKEKLSPKVLQRKEEEASEKIVGSDGNKDFNEFQFSIDPQESTQPENSVDESPSEKRAEAENLSESMPNSKKKNKHIEKTKIIIRPEEDHDLVSDKNELEEKQSKQKPVAESGPSFSDETRAIDINEYLPLIQDEAIAFEREVELQQIKEDAFQKTDIENSADKKTKKKSKKRKGIRPIAAVAFIVILTVLFLDKPKESKEPRSLLIQFPVVQEVENQKLARDKFMEGMLYYEEGDYISKTLASGLFRESLSHQFRGNPALGMLILVYSELFENALDRTRGAANLFRLIKIAEPLVLTDVNVAIGSAKFFLLNEKNQTAVNLIENYLRVNAATPRLLATYLSALIETGALEQAAAVAKRLQELERKETYIYRSLIRFYRINQDFSKVKELLEEVLHTNPHQVYFLLEFAEISLREGDYQRFALTLELINELAAERSPVFAARFLEFRGMLAALKGENSEATNFFRLSLAIRESRELRGRLASLALGGDRAVEILILESRIWELIRRSQLAARNYEWENAFVFAIEAVDLLPSNVSARLNLSDIQIERGFFNKAIESLKKLYDSYPLDPQVNYYYGMAMVRANKFAQANTHITRIDHRLHDTPEFVELLARYYLQRGDIELAVKWFISTIQLNPLGDRNYFDLAMIYLRNRDYERARTMLLDAISLNPSNIIYRTAYAEILFDLEGASTAIGYLNEVLVNHPNHPKILGDIAMYYYRNGQVRDYERYREKVEKSPIKDPSFYEFKIRDAQLHDKPEDVVKYARELIKINPGDIKTRMKLAEFLIRLNRLPDAENVLKEIKTRLDSYPRLHYLLAKINFNLNNMTAAQTYAKREIELNPEIEQGHFILGQIYESLGDIVSAVESYERALSLRITYVDALMALANIRHRQNFLIEARQLYMRARNHDEHNPRIWRQLGFVHRAAGELGAAIEALETYLRLDPGTQERRQIEQIIEQMR